MRYQSVSRATVSQRASCGPGSSRTSTTIHRLDHDGVLHATSDAQASNKKVIGKEEWEKKLAEVDLPKEDLNCLVMNFLVTEVGQPLGPHTPPIGSELRGWGRWGQFCSEESRQTSEMAHLGTQQWGQDWTSLARVQSNTTMRETGGDGFHHGFRRLAPYSRLELLQQ